MAHSPKGSEPMKPVSTTCPLTRQQVIQQYFLEHRARLLDVAAFLDRLDRSSDSGEPDFRELALRQALDVLADNQPHRTARILHLLSDHTTDLPQSAHGMKGALGAVKLSEGTTP